MGTVNPLPKEVPVLIVGAGPIGLALAAYLGKQGVQTLLVEREEDRRGSPKMIVVSARTMEFCRHLGIAEAARNWGFPIDHSLDSVFVTGLQGHELGRVKTPPLRVQYDTPHSPERERPCPQTWFDPILKQYAAAQRTVDIRYCTRLESFEHDQHGVAATLIGPSGETHRVNARFMVGADGFGSTVRKLLGIDVRGSKHLDVSMSVYLTIPNLNSRHGIGDAYRYLFVGEQGVWAVLTTIDGHDLYRLQLIGVRDRDMPDIDAIMRKCIGENIEYELHDATSWVRKSTVADRFSDGNVFLAGDAAHAHPPNGGLGMNTGILDAWDLGWKLTAVIKGWGGAHLLASYDFERRPACAFATEESLRNYGRLVELNDLTGICGDTADAAALRAEAGRRLVEANSKAWDSIGINLSHVYFPSPIVVDDGSSPESARWDGQYRPTARPGARAPHVWLDEGVISLLDVFGSEFTLLRFSAIDVSPLQAAAQQRGVPLSVVDVHNESAAELYERKLVLVRPDGHVAWRGDTLPSQCSQLIEKVRGNTAPIGARCKQLCKKEDEDETDVEQDLIANGD